MRLDLDTDNYDEWEAGAKRKGCTIEVKTNYVWQRGAFQRRRFGRVSVAKKLPHLAAPPVEVGTYIHDVVPKSWTRKRGVLNIP